MFIIKCTNTKEIPYYYRDTWQKSYKNDAAVIYSLLGHCSNMIMMMLGSKSILTLASYDTKVKSSFDNIE